MKQQNEIRARIDAVYRILTNTVYSHGSLAWFRLQTGVSYSTIQRWVTGATVPGYAWRILWNLEERAKEVPITEEAE